MKRLFILSITVLILFSMFPATIHADKVINLYLNGTQLYPEVAPRIVDNHTLVPLRVVAEQLGADVAWDQSERKVSIAKDQSNIALFIDSKKATVNGEQVSLPTAPVIMDGNTMLPLRYISDSLGVKVIWDVLTSSVFLYKKDEIASGDNFTAADASSTLVQTIADSSISEPPLSAISSTTEPFQAEQGAQEKSMNSITPFPEAKPTETISQQPPSNLSGVSATNSLLPVIGSIQSIGEHIVIQSDRLVKPNIFYLKDPDRIVMDLPNSTFGSTLNGEAPLQNGVIPSHHPLISTIRYALFSNDPTTVRVVIDLKQQAQYQVRENAETNQISLILKSALYKVVIDPGHGGHDPGATGASGKFEKEYTLSLSDKVHKLLEKEPLIKSYITRSDDTFIELQDRARFANDLKADLFVSIHGNTYEKGSVRGTETYYSRSDSLSLADMLHKHIMEVAGFPDREVRQMNYRVIRDTVMPAVLLEIGYLSNSSEEKEMLQDDLQNKIAASIVTSIKEYLHIQ